MILLMIMVLVLFIHSDCKDDKYPDLSGTWQVVIETTGTTCLFDDDLIDNYTVIIEQTNGNGTITIYDLDDTNLTTYLIRYNFTITTDGAIKIAETAEYNPAYGLPDGVSSATSSMNASGTASSTSISMTYNETVTANLIDGPVPQYVCIRTGNITGSK
jgi:hypothetical protein